MNIGILQSAGIAGKIIEVALNHPEHTDVFTPVIYSKENQNDKNVGSDLKFGNIQAVVVAPGSSTEFKFEGSVVVYIDDRLRLATAVPGKSIGEMSAALTKEVLTDCLRKCWMSLKRDFGLTMPRIGIVALNDTIDEAEKNIIAPAVAEATAEGIGVFGPYVLDDYLEENKFQHFDMTVVISDEQAQKMLGMVSSDLRTRFIAGIPMVMAQTDYSAAYEFDEADLEEPAQALRDAVYNVMDISRNRKVYDEAHKNPLPKLYHERRDDSEKVRFAVKKAVTP